MPQLATVLEPHLQEKLRNSPWLFETLQGNTRAFPHRVVYGAQAETARPFFFQSHASLDVQTDCRRRIPRFVVNIPLGRAPSVACDYRAYKKVIKLLEEESFGRTDQISKRLAKSGIAVVLGINQIDSIDPAFNRSFKRFIKKLPPMGTLTGRTYGFFWKPQWRAARQGVYACKKAFFLLKVLSSQTANKVRTKYEMPNGRLHSSIISQVPFQAIRETIKNSQATRKIITKMQEKFPSAPIYYTVMDADFSSLRGASNRKGIFSCVKEIIARHNHPSIVSPGYRVHNQELALIQLGVQIDMAVRAAMAPLLPYFPEPFTAFKIRNPNEPDFFRYLSFLGRGQALETRRFRESGLQYLNDGAVLENQGSVVTQAPERMKTIKNKRVGFTLTRTQIKQKQCLQAIRGISQSHAFPKQWADILYSGLDFSAGRVTNATTQMMRIFSVFDPISRMFAMPGKYSESVFDRVMRDYNQPLLLGQLNLLVRADIELLGLGMNEPMRGQVLDCAKRSGAAIYRVLQDVTRNGHFPEEKEVTD